MCQLTLALEARRASLLVGALHAVRRIHVQRAVVIALATRLVAEVCTRIGGRPLAVTIEAWHTPAFRRATEE